MADHFDEDGSWWDRASRRHERRPFERTREHRVIGDHDDVPVVHEHADDAWDEPSTWVVPERGPRPPATGVDPRLMRLGAIAAAAVVLVPVVVALTASGSDDGQLRADKVTTIETVAPQAPSDASDDTGVPVSAAVSYIATTEPAEADDDAEAAAGASGEKGRPQAVDEPAEGSEEPAADEEPECAGTYTVVPGDHWVRFVDSSGATLDEWLAANDAQPTTQIYEGDELCIPAGAQAPTPIEAPAPDPESDPESAAADDDGTEDTTTTLATTTTVAPAPAPQPASAPTSPAGAPSTEGLCGSMPTDNGSPAGVAGPAEVESIIREIWPDDIEVRALCIAKREANLRPDLNNWCCYGVFALYFDFVPADLKTQYGVDEPADLWDARTNVAIAYQIYERSGWDPWSQTDPGSG